MGNTFVSFPPPSPGGGTTQADLLPLLWGLDGTRQLGDVLADLPSEKRAEGLALASRLVELGFAEPAAG